MQEGVVCVHARVRGRSGGLVVELFEEVMRECGGICLCTFVVREGGRGVKEKREETYKEIHQQMQPFISTLDRQKMKTKTHQKFSKLTWTSLAQLSDGDRLFLGED